MSMFERVSAPPKVENQEQKPFNLEIWLSLKLKNQYETKAKILNQLGLLEILPKSQEIGILGIDGQEYPFPKMEAIEQELKNNKELFETKIAQGFTELEIVPFAMPLQRLINTLKKQLFKHHKEGKLFHTKKNQDDPNEELKPFDLKEDDPLYVWDNYQNADENGELFYDIKKFSKKNHQGKTKQEMIEALKQSQMPGYLVTFREKSINIPREGKGEIKHNRKQLEANKTPKEYLQLLLKGKQYKGEFGQTLEEWITEFLIHLEETNQVIDDYQGNGSASYLIGMFFHVSGNVPFGYSFHNNRQVYLDGNFPDCRNHVFGARSAVRVNRV